MKMGGSKSSGCKNTARQGKTMKSMKTAPAKSGGMKKMGKSKKY